MPRVAVLALATLFAVIPLTSVAAERIEYAITLQPDQGDLPPVEARLTVIVQEAGPGQPEVRWYLAQPGSHALPWPQRVGRWIYDRDEGTVAERPAQLAVRLDERTYVVDVPIPLFQVDPTLEVGAVWTRDSIDFSIVRREARGGQRRLIVEGRNGFGSVARLALVEGSDLVAAMEKTVVIGQGDLYRLEYHIDGRETVPAAEIDSLLSDFDQLEAIAQAQQLSEDNRQWAVDADEREIALDLLEEVSERSDNEWIDQLVSDGLDELIDQSRRSASIERMRLAIVGDDMPAFDLLTLDGERIDSTTLRGRTVVLHFWNYRHEGLDQPYGQVGFLDFLARRQDADDVAIIGVTQVTAEAVDEAEYRRQVASARRLREFMNLSFEVAIDEGALLAAVGDPRAAQEQLPLWLVIDPAGQVVEYRAGLFDTDPQQGLVDLRRLIETASRIEQ